jgi:multiple antibiotic resistance protein
LDVSSLLAFDLSSFVASFVLLFSVFDVIGTLPLFLALTQDYKDSRGQIVRDAVLIATIILLVFAAAGQLIFKLLGITINDFKVAGGIVLFIIAIDNLRGRVSQTKTIAATEIAAFPLATPLLAGPGAISTVMIYANPPYGLVEDFLVILLNSLVTLSDSRAGDVGAEGHREQRDAGLHEDSRAPGRGDWDSLRERGRPRDYPGLDGGRRVGAPVGRGDLQGGRLGDGPGSGVQGLDDGSRSNQPGGGMGEEPGGRGRRGAPPG